MNQFWIKLWTNSQYYLKRLPAISTTIWRWLRLPLGVIGALVGSFLVALPLLLLQTSPPRVLLTKTLPLMLGVTITLVYFGRSLNRTWGHFDPFHWPTRRPIFKWLVVSLLSLAGVNIVTSLASQLTTNHVTAANQTQLVNHVLAAQPLLLTTWILLLVVITPILEELFYRGLLYHGLNHYFNATGAMVVQAIIFASFHDFTNGWFFLGYFCLGILTNWLVIRTKSLLPAILLHASNNLLSLLFTLL